MRAKRFHWLKAKRFKVRQTWNKHNLYNLSRMRPAPTSNRTFFQQKWTAKSATRAYHGEQVREGQWEKMFSSKLRSVIPMDHKYLGSYDGSEQAEGRGSGKDLHPVEQAFRQPQKPISYMQMTYAPLERRLDTAIFRALFASSARQARQFVIHGNVRVNGKKMIYPGYLLNPGDMFQVDIERVLWATGAPKDSIQRRVGRLARKKEVTESEAGTDSGEPTSAIEASETQSATESPEEGSLAEAGAIEEKSRNPKDPKESLKDLLQTVKSTIADPRDAPSAKRKQDLRALQLKIRKTIGRVDKMSEKDIEHELDGLFSKLDLHPTKDSTPSGNNKGQDQPATGDRSESRVSDAVALRTAIMDARDNPIDASKPYATPWQPRPYMSAFTFIPRYLEVNQKICSAVYLRHPVARPGISEVPTPFPPEISQLAFSWYLRRR